MATGVRELLASFLPPSCVAWFDLSSAAPFGRFASELPCLCTVEWWWHTLGDGSVGVEWLRPRKCEAGLAFMDAAKPAMELS
jgi:hypothetical protein